MGKEKSIEVRHMLGYSFLVDPNTKRMPPLEEYEKLLNNLVWTLSAIKKYSSGEPFGEMFMYGVMFEFFEVISPKSRLINRNDFVKFSPREKRNLRGVYFVAENYNPKNVNVVKIGCTENFHGRHKQLCHEYQKPLELVYFIEYEEHKRLEKILHSVFSKNHYHGEFFNLTGEDLKDWLSHFYDNYEE